MFCGLVVVINDLSVDAVQPVSALSLFSRSSKFNPIGEEVSSPVLRLLGAKIVVGFEFGFVGRGAVGRR